MPEHKLFQIEWDRLDSRLVGQKLFEGLELSFFLDWMGVGGCQDLSGWWLSRLRK